jgi:hypothetical protein
MKQKTTLVSVFMTLVMLFGLVPAPQPALAVATCDWAQFVADVTIPDGTTYSAGATFTKTWRLKNIGSCTWSTNYSLAFVSGERMSDPAITVKMPKSVAPGGTVDLTINMTAPGAAGTYRGNWQLKNAGGALFGIGATANKSFWVEIRVTSGGGTGTGYDFVANASSATWTSSAGALSFPGTDGDNKGFAKKLDSPKLENGSTDTAPGLLTAPQNTYNGYIQAQYPAFKVQSGDRFQSIINCEYGATSCYVNFRLNYQIGSGPVRTFWSFNERYEGLYYRANLDLSSLAGQEVKFILYVGAAGYATGDRALWGAPRIARGGSPPPITPTVTGTPPTPTATSTPKPGTSACRATFVSDVNYPDGIAVAPNTAFTKTWRIKNTGTCTWTTNFSLVFVSGDKMGGPDSKKLTSTVGPNTTFNISVDLTSPATNGSYKGYWQLKDDKGQLFGIGASGDKPWWVDISVRSGVTAVPTTPIPVTPGPSSGVFDFAPLAASAAWTSGAGALPFPGGDGDVRGFAIKLDSIKMETGSTVTNPTLLTVPQNVTDGFIQGVYPAFTVQGGDRFQATIGCQDAATACYVTYRLDYQIGNGAVSTFWAFRERYEGLTYNVNLDLSSLAGQNVKFILTILATGSAAGDRAVWIAPRITRPGGTTPVVPTVAPDTVTPTPTPTGTVTPTQTSSTLKDGLAYANPFFGYQFKYPKNAKITDQQQASVHFVMPFTPGTNLIDKWLDVVGREISNTDECVSNNPAPQPQSQTVTINGITFLRQSGEDAAMGHRYPWVAYSTVRETTCVTFSLAMKARNPAMLETPPILFNEAAETAILSEMVGTFTWLTQYAVYNIKNNDVLNVRTAAGVGNPLATTLPYDKQNVFRTGSTATASSAEWWQIYKADGTKGWVNASYLTEFRSASNACTDARIGTLLGKFEAAIKSANGAALSTLVSPKHGLSVRYSAYTATPVTLSKSAMAGVFTSTTSYNWGIGPGSGINVVGTFKDKIQPKLLDVLNVNYQATCNDTSHTGPVTHPWPSEYTNLNFYALYKPGTPGTEMDWRTWLAGIEYVDGVPYITALVHYQWEP